MGKIKNKSKPLQALIAAFVAMLLAATPAIAMADMVGIDVSGWQAENVTCTASYDFAVVKVSQGIGFENSSWRTQAKCVTDRGKSLGLYHYAGGNNAEAEADYFVAKARDYIGRAVLVLDWESYQNAQWGNGDWVRRFAQRVHTLTGVWPMVYVQASALRQIPGDVRANCGLWVAQYASNAPTGYQSRPWNYAIDPSGNFAQNAPMEIHDFALSFSDSQAVLEIIKSYLDVDWVELISNATTKSVPPRDYTMILTVPETDYEIIGAFATASIPEYILN